jgi:hypothetical protein
VRSFNSVHVAVRNTGPATPRAVSKSAGPAKPTAQTCEKNALAHGGFTDEQVLDVRGMYQFQGVSMKELADTFGRDPMYIRTICRYLTRCRLEPRREDYPVGMKGRKA